MVILVTWAAAFLLLAVMGGGVVVWSVCLCAVIATAAWALVPAGRPLPLSRPLLGLVCALGGLLAVVVFSLVPLPDGLIGIAGEPRASQHREAAAALKTAAQVGLPKTEEPLFALTRNAAGTGRMLVLMLAAVSMAALASRLGDAGRQRLMAFLSLAGTAIAILGYIAQHYVPQGDTLWWWFPVQHSLPGPIACFGNRNHFAGFLALVSVAALAACLHGARRRKLDAILVHGVAFSAMAVVLVLTLSRGALLAWATGTVAVFVFGLARRPVAVILMSLVAAGLVAGAIVSLPKLPVPPRYMSLVKPFDTSSAATRLDAWRDCLKIWASYPVFGAGANGYRTVFPQHRHTTEGSYATYPENLYLQVLAETGTVGAGFLLAFICAGGYIAWRRWRESDADRSSVIAGIGAGTVVLAHGMVDMPLQVPLYAVAAATLAGILVVPAPPEDAPPSLPRLRLFLAVPALLVTGFLSFDSGRLRTFDAPTFLEYASARDIQRAVVWAPSSWHAWYYLGRHAFMLQTPDAARFGAHCFDRAGERDPNNYRLWLELGKTRQSVGDIEGARAAYKRVRELRSWVQIPELPEPRP